MLITILFHISKHSHYNIRNIIKKKIIKKKHKSSHHYLPNASPI